MHIRYLTAMLDMASDKTSTLPFPLPIDPLAGLRDGGLRDLLAGRHGKRRAARLAGHLRPAS